MQRDEMIAFAREAKGLSEAVPLRLFPLTGRGSDRAYFRLKWNREDSVVLVHYDPQRVENAYFAEIAEFLFHIHVPVPRLIRHDPAVCLIIMEDLGDRDLWSFREAPWEIRQVLYQKTLTVAHRLHSFRGRDLPSDRVRLMEPFGPELYRWERDYFRENLVRGACGMALEPSFERELEAELSALAGRLSGTRQCLVHRDLQSQNVMIREGEPFFIDFQGMRFGNLFYDLGSILCDPYVTFSEAEEEELLSFYYGLSKKDLDWAAFKNCYWEGSVERLMQALGAYGFLGLKKGLPAFLDHVPAGLSTLRRAAGHVPALPRMQELSQRLSP